MTQPAKRITAVGVVVGVLLGVAACGGIATSAGSVGASTPIKAVHELFSDLESGKYQQLAGLIRTSAGEPLPSKEKQLLLKSWKTAFGKKAGFSVSHVDVIGRSPLNKSLLSKLHAEAGVVVTFDVQGRSHTKCFKLPGHHEFLQVIKQTRAWYLVESIPGEFNFEAYCSLKIVK